MDDKYAFEVAKLAAEKYFDLHREQLINLSSEDFASFYTRTIENMLRVVNIEINHINNEKTSGFSSNLL